MRGAKGSVMLGLMTSLVLSLTIAEAAEHKQGYNFGRELAPAEVAQLDTDLAPTGDTPTGSGNAIAGRVLYAQHCVACHGVKGEGGLHESLVMPATGDETFAQDPSQRRTLGNYWPYATTVYDFIKRSMPQATPGSLSNDEVYALTAYLLFANGLIAEDVAVNGAVLQKLKMPALARYRWSKEAQKMAPVSAPE